MSVISSEGGGLTSLKMDCSRGKPRVHTGETPLEASVDDGQRILCLDGGGVKGLIIVEILIYIENLTGRKIVELFDWIVGTSAGGIIALALVYGRFSELPANTISYTSVVLVLFNSQKEFTGIEATVLSVQR